MIDFHIPTMAELSSKGEEPEVLLWVGCAGSFDERAKKITKAFARILHKAKVKFAVLAGEESCTGDPAKRAGNEYLFQMQALCNIQTLNKYNIKTIVTFCPHCFNTIKNEYPSLGGQYKVYHHTQYIKELIEQKRLDIDKKGDKLRVTYHDPCYLGRANQEYDSARDLLGYLNTELVEMNPCRGNAMCCGAGGAQIFKESEKGTGEINDLRAKQALEVNPDVIVTGCPFCNTMITDGVKNNDNDKGKEVEVKDIVELF